MESAIGLLLLFFVSSVFSIVVPLYTLNQFILLSDVVFLLFSLPFSSPLSVICLLAHRDAHTSSTFVFCRPVIDVHRPLRL